jgi:hypothetical protein
VLSEAIECRGWVWIHVSEATAVVHHEYRASRPAPNLGSDQGPGDTTCRNKVLSKMLGAALMRGAVQNDNNFQREKQWLP